MKIIAIRISLLAAGAACLFPPYTGFYDRNGADGAHTQKPDGHSFIFAPPAPVPDDHEHGVKINIQDLAVELLAIAALGATAIITLKK